MGSNNSAKFMEREGRFGQCGEREKEKEGEEEKFFLFPFFLEEEKEIGR